MNTLEIVSILVTTAALFGWISSRLLKLPITIGTMLLTVGTSLLVANVARLTPGVEDWAARFAGRIVSKTSFFTAFSHCCCSPALPSESRGTGAREAARDPACGARHRHQLSCGGRAYEAAGRPSHLADRVPHLRRSHLAY